MRKHEDSEIRKIFYPVKQKELEKQIDELVYKLYDLFPEEIEIVESSIK